MTKMEAEEGGKCPFCEKGHLQYEEVEECSCHVSPPCFACVDAILICDSCGEPAVPCEPDA